MDFLKIFSLLVLAHRQLFCFVVFEPFDGNYHFSNACEVETEPNENLDTRFGNEFENWSNHAMLFLFSKKAFGKDEKRKNHYGAFQENKFDFGKS